MSKIQIIAGFIGIVLAGCGRSDNNSTKEAAAPFAAAKPTSTKEQSQLVIIEAKDVKIMDAAGLRLRFQLAADKDETLTFKVNQLCVETKKAKLTAIGKPFSFSPTSSAMEAS